MSQFGSLSPPYFHALTTYLRCVWGSSSTSSTSCPTWPSHVPTQPARRCSER